MSKVSNHRMVSVSWELVFHISFWNQFEIMTIMWDPVNKFKTKCDYFIENMCIITIIFFNLQCVNVIKRTKSSMLFKMKWGFQGSGRNSALYPLTESLLFITLNTQNDIVLGLQTIHYSQAPQMMLSELQSVNFPKNLIRPLNVKAYLSTLAINH